MFRLFQCFLIQEINCASHGNREQQCNTHSNNVILKYSMSSVMLSPWDSLLLRKHFVRYCGLIA